MGVDLPDLDDRSYEELLADARKRIPVHAEQWTDHNAHDPGITILELLTWLAETHTYQLDQITDHHRRKYLELVDVAPEPPAQATAALSLTVPTPDLPPAALDTPAALDDLAGERVGRGTPLVAETPDGHRERFRTTESVVVSAGEVATVVAVHGGGTTDHTRANRTEGLHFRAFGSDPEPGDVLYVGFDANPFAVGPLELHVDFHEANLPDAASHGEEAVTFEPSLRCVWEHCVSPADWYESDAWERVTVERDDTNALYGGGRVTLARPSNWLDAPAVIAGHDGGYDGGLYWVRCRLAREAGDDPTPARYEVPPQLNRLRTDVVPAAHWRRETDVVLETSDGRERTSAAPGQRFEFPDAPVQSAEVTVGGSDWPTVSDLDAAGPDDEVVVFDAATGTLTFGDGRRGAIPEPGLHVEADYDAGGGPTGNLPPTADWWFVATALADLGVDPVAPPSGGREAESIDEALASARDRRRVPFRAVSAADHAYVATHTPGLRFGRASLVDAPPGAEPATVVVVPYSPDGRRPVPSEGFLRAVEAHCCRHALLTETVTVVGPRYVPVDLSVTVDPEPSADPARVRHDVRESLSSFLDPLDGFDGDGWPFGRPVYTSELYEQLEGIDVVVDAVDVGVSTGGWVAVGDRTDTLPALDTVHVELAGTDGDCGGWS